MRTCTSCGHLCDDNAKFCPKCAYGFSSELLSTQNQLVNNVKQDELKATESDTTEVVTPDVITHESVVQAAHDEIVPDVSNDIADDIELVVNIPEETPQNEKGLLDVMKEKNKLDLVYNVSMLADSVSMPKFCNCCMTPTSGYEMIKTSISKSTGYNTTTTRTTSLPFPLCPECVAHRKVISNKKWMMNCISVAAGLILVIIFAALNLMHLAWFFSIIASLATFFTLGFLLMLEPLDDSHSAREKSVSMKLTSFDTTHVSYSFSNWAFAHLFAAANNAQIAEESKKNHVKEEKLFPALSKPLASIAFVLCITLLVLIFAGMISAGLTSSSSAGRPAPPPPAPLPVTNTETPPGDIIAIPSAGGIVHVNRETYFSFMPDRSGFWQFSTSDNGGDDPFLTVLNSNGDIIGADDDSGENFNAVLLLYLDEGHEYLIHAGFFGDVDHGYILTAAKYDLPELPGNGGYTQITGTSVFLFTPGSSGIWEFETSDNDGHDPMLAIHNVHGILIKEDDDSGDGFNAHLSVELEAGTGYVVIVRFYMTDVGTCLLTVTNG